MPFIRTAVRKGTDARQKQHIVEGIHDALIEAIGMPADELFNLVSEYDAGISSIIGRLTALRGRTG